MQYLWEEMILDICYNVIYIQETHFPIFRQYAICRSLNQLSNIQKQIITHSERKDIMVLEVTLAQLASNHNT